MKIFTIFDSKADYYLPPFFARTNAEAIRTFSQAVNDSSHHIGQNHADFTLFYIGDYDETTGFVDGGRDDSRIHHSLGNGVDFKAQ